jgi:hypothetical protein
VVSPPGVVAEFMAPKRRRPIFKAALFARGPCQRDPSSRESVNYMTAGKGRIQPLQRFTPMVRGQDG